ncbi:MAG: SDR family NAD(P)-dependent oxidoreductase [Rhodobacterales bacterium]|nr:MAG: SDR family NAD(P)-dependent oxidoreductase [Rhodobacterales bacterium]
MTPQTILITGATSGIGLGLAQRLHALGHHIILTGRRRALLDAATTVHPGMAAYQNDITDPAQIADLAARLAVDHPDLSMVIHNAGIMKPERLGANQTDLSISEATIATNLLGPIRLAHALMPQLLRQPKAQIITVTSGLAFVPLALTPTYSATKAAIHSWSQSLRFQLEGTGVTVHELAPPGVQTDLMPGHRISPHAMPFDAFIDEVMAIMAQDPVPDEILVERVKAFRNAEGEGRYSQTFEALNRNYRPLD